MTSAISGAAGFQIIRSFLQQFGPDRHRRVRPFPQGLPGCPDCLIHVRFFGDGNRTQETFIPRVDHFDNVTTRWVGTIFRQ